MNKIIHTTPTLEPHAQLGDQFRTRLEHWTQCTWDDENRRHRGTGAELSDKLDFDM
jgi:hypothetical protein